MTLALTLLFTLNLYRQLNHEKAQKPQEAQEGFWSETTPFLGAFCAFCASLCLFVPLCGYHIDRVRKEFVNTFSSLVARKRRLVTKQSHCLLKHSAAAAKMPRSFAVPSSHKKQK